MPGLNLQIFRAKKQVTHICICFISTWQLAVVRFHTQTLLLLLFSWVAYEKPGFEGHQYLLEEGAYRDWTDWGGYDEELQSLRPIVGVSSKNT